MIEHPLQSILAPTSEKNFLITILQKMVIQLRNVPTSEKKMVSDLSELERNLPHLPPTSSNTYGAPEKVIHEASSGETDSTSKPSKSQDSHRDVPPRETENYFCPTTQCCDGSYSSITNVVSKSHSIPPPGRRSRGTQPNVQRSEGSPQLFNYEGYVGTRSSHPDSGDGRHRRPIKRESPKGEVPQSSYRTPSHDVVHVPGRYRFSTKQFPNFSRDSPTSTSGESARRNHERSSTTSESDQHTPSREQRSSKGPVSLLQSKLKQTSTARQQRSTSSKSRKSSSPTSSPSSYSPPEQETPLLQNKTSSGPHLRYSGDRSCLKKSRESSFLKQTDSSELRREQEKQRRTQLQSTPEISMNFFPKYSRSSPKENCVLSFSSRMTESMYNLIHTEVVYSRMTTNSYYEHNRFEQVKRILGDTCSAMSSINNKVEILLHKGVTGSWLRTGVAEKSQHLLWMTLQRVLLI
ncbi:hypothetical protein VP01_3885g1 [Puccinia sorghi]|uniref:Uncharacterized protein n=1 Tax=Puccinia sorghi TaxID=27349 RepID=A0A0L6UTN2_9BASI|nr:hypothetical protein VP01_3885g1 [Puccinia sorghi]